MAAKIALYVLGGLLLIPGLYQFVNVIELQQYKYGIMGQVIDMMITRKITFGVILTLAGAAMLFGASKIKTNPSNEGQ